jgi:prepilin-type N-terminal cleavage/methylation domain-containing protein
MRQKGFSFQNGYSLIEILVVIAIAGILAGLAVAGLIGLTKKYNVDNQVRGIFADMMNVRIMAMNKNRTHYVTLAASCYTAYDDNSPAPDGDGTLTVGSDTVALTSNGALNLNTTKSQGFLPITWSGADTLSFNSRGICTTPTTICLYSTVQPLYDCIKISSTRILLGKLITQGVCSANNCQAK